MSSPGFEAVPLGEACCLITDGSHFSPTPREEGYPIVNAKDIPKGRVELDTCTRISEREYRLLKIQNCAPLPGDVLLSKDGTIGRVVHYKEDLGVVLLSSVAILRPKTMVTPAFLAHALRSHFFDRQLFRLQSGSALKRLVLGDIRKIRVPVPKLEIQDGIADILSTLDEAIEQTESLIAKYQQIKAGLMHDLFTHGVTPNGHLRPTRAQAPHLYRESPLGWIPKEWEVFAIAQLGTLGRGRVISQDYLEVHPGEYPVYSSQSIDEGVFGKIDTYDFEGEYVTWTTDGAFAGTVFYRCGRFNCTNVCGTIHPFVFVDARFLAGVLSGKTSRHVSYVGNPKLMNNVMAKIQVPIPKNIAEQKTIAQRIEAAGLVLKSHAEDLRKLRQQKHGLMQDLLTGRVRVTNTKTITASS